jgi:translation elongation factor EF-1alpha
MQPTVNALVIGPKGGGISYLMGSLLRASDPSQIESGASGAAASWDALQTWNGSISCGSLALPTCNLNAFHTDAIPSEGTFPSKIDSILVVIPAAYGEFEGCLSSKGAVRQLISYAHDNLGATRCVLAITKMDCTEPPFSMERFTEIKGQTLHYVARSKFNANEVPTVPVAPADPNYSNVVEASAAMRAYKGWNLLSGSNGLTLLNALEFLALP